MQIKKKKYTLASENIKPHHLLFWHTSNRKKVNELIFSMYTGPVKSDIKPPLQAFSLTEMVSGYQDNWGSLNIKQLCLSITFNIQSWFILQHYTHDARNS
jgi:hypothetical protein